VTERPLSTLMESMATFRYQLIGTDGSDLGPFVSSHGDWHVGALIPHPAGYLRVKALVEPLAGETFRAYLLVEDFSAGQNEGANRRPA
jgi:hypothetical protein